MKYKSVLVFWCKCCLSKAGRVRAALRNMAITTTANARVVGKTTKFVEYKLSHYEHLVHVLFTFRTNEYE